ncbi:Aldose 1-/Glucose-6-phosphate 1-epimerase [Carpediemonas membranifera]|uniref:Aldose 1-/Glucose-6-phosphate 1-epimerase n=1 Tax=Carpediemonas membranifera TaxID=201153 RepID=A0A8J6ASW8_9EUKA|nr:Aldose 1-/Glucose-6-phosphate 1-epimerase [Carpediemonas membranifera]|eukprot:KAG9390660.1 Aldose 1-/Glucose-6-phosphate 1-epimerase [Carpediemonas membranifera]
MKTLGTAIALQNKSISAIIDTFGAKMTSLVVDGHEMLYFDDDDVSHSGIPICMPSFGVPSEGNGIHLGQHGFFRDFEFDVLEQGTDQVTLGLSSKPEMKSMYPFDFSATITYELTDFGAKLTLGMKNEGDKALPVAPGVHPYFAVSDADNIIVTTPATTGNDNTAGYAEIPLKDSAFFQETTDSSGQSAYRVCGAPDYHFMDHEGKISMECGGRRVTVSHDSRAFKRTTVWRKTELEGYVCIEPSFVRQGILTDPIVVSPGDEWKTDVEFSLEII